MGENPENCIVGGDFNFTPNPLLDRKNVSTARFKCTDKSKHSFEKFNEKASAERHVASKTSQQEKPF